VAVQPGQTVAVKTGIACEFPEGWGGIIKARSSQGKAGIDVFGGVVDSGYRGEITVLLYNSNAPIEFRGSGGPLGPNDFYQYDPTVIYNHGDKVAQLVLVPVFPGTIQEATTLGESSRGTQGFGSTGR
jgi:dUTPase